MMLITGHPRSGTKYTSVILQKIGYDMPHEDVGKHGAVGWMFAQPGRIFGKFVSQNGFKKKVQVVRNPLAVVGTMPTIRMESWNFLINAVGKPDGNDKIEWGFWTWLHWNTICERFCEYRYRIEDFEGDEGIKILTEIGLSVDKWPDVSLNTNHRPFTPYDLRTLVDKNRPLMTAVDRKAREYGYDLCLHSILEG